MVDFCIEPKEHRPNPVGQLDMKVDQYYSAIYSKLYNHINDTVVHITQEEREAWNNKASKDALKDLQDQLEQLAGDGDDSIKNEILIEVTKQITEAIADLNLGEYAKKKYVDDAIKNIKIDGYITKSEADSTYLKIVDYTKFDADSYYTKAEIQNLLKNFEGGTDYSISEFSVSGDKLTLTQKNGGQFEVTLPTTGSGDIDTDELKTLLNNYIKKGSLAKLEINGNVVSLENGGTIKIPTGGGGSSVDPSKFGYYQQYFKENTSNTQAPELPEDYKAPDNNSGWVKNCPNTRTGYYIWMTQVFIDGNDSYGQYRTAICLNAGNGGNSSAGEDNDTINFIYRQYQTTETVYKPGSVQLDSNGTPIVPNEWNNHPSGVTKDHPYEYCSYVLKTDGTWGTEWAEPFIWSHYGQNGMDGDGVEYIFYAGQTIPTTNLPETWYTDNGYQQREYIRENSGWSDDPVDLEELGAGSKQWVCTRKYYATDNDGNRVEEGDAYWQPYSSPALWGYYAKDGVVSSIIIDVVGENKYLYLDDNEDNLGYSGQSTVNMYNSGDPISFSLTVDKVVCSDGTTLDDHTVQDYFSVTNSGNSNILSIYIPAEDLSFSNNKYYIIYITGTPDSSNINSQSRSAQIQLFGLKQGGSGDNAISYDLKISATAINKQDGSLYPNTINATIVKSDGANQSTIDPDNNEGWEFQYSVDDGETYKDIDSNPVATEGDDGMLFRAKNTSLNLTLSEFVPIVKSPSVEGINGVSYSLKVSNLLLTYKPSESAYEIKLTGDVNLYEIQPNVEPKELTSSDDIKLYFKVNGSSNYNMTYSDGAWQLSYESGTNSPNMSISIYAYKGSGYYLTSIVIPLSAAGKDGDASTGQSLKGSPLRLVGSWVQGTTYYDGKRATDKEGVFYQDIVNYNNSYYACIDTDAGVKNNWQLAPDVASFFSEFALSPDIVADKLITNKAFIKELSSQEVVIFDDDSKIVAGMTSGRNVEGSQLDSSYTKGDVRIWAGGITNGDLTTAPFTVDNKGNVNAKVVTLENVTFKNPVGNTYITQEARKIQIGSQLFPITVGGLFTEDADGNRVISLDYINSLISGVQYKAPRLNLTTDGYTTNISERRINVTNGNGSSSFTLGVGSSGVGVSIVGNTTINIPNLPVYLYTYNAQNDSSLNVGDMYLIQDMVTDSNIGDYYDYTVHIKGKKIS